jgi:hypothetical protein
MNIQLKVIVMASVLVASYLAWDKYRFSQAMSEKYTITECGVYQGWEEKAFGKYTKTFFVVDFNNGVTKRFKVFSDYYKYPIKNEIQKLFKSHIGDPVCLKFTASYTLDESPVIVGITFN